MAAAPRRRPQAQGAALPAQPALRWNWDTPIVVSHFDPASSTWRADGVSLAGSTARPGRRSARISRPGIDPATLQMMGAPCRRRAVAPRRTVALRLADVDRRVAGRRAGHLHRREDGTVQVTKDGGKTWTNSRRRFPGVPEHTYVSTVLPSATRPAASMRRSTATTTTTTSPYVFVSEDFGQTWRAIVCGPPVRPPSIAFASIRVIRTSSCSARARRALLDRRRADVDSLSLADEHADRAGRRSGHSPARQRACPRHAWTRHLDSRRRRPCRC